MQSIEKAVVDANVLIHSRGQISVDTVLIPFSVKAEIKSDLSNLKMQKLNFQKFRPSKEALEQVGRKSDQICSPTSDQDEDALALAIDRDVPLVTDDKALQNLALHLGVDFEGFNTEKVSEKRTWKRVCDNCGEELSSLPCARCGSHQWSRKRDQRS